LSRSPGENSRTLRVSKTAYAAQRCQRIRVSPRSQQPVSRLTGEFPRACCRGSLWSIVSIFRCSKFVGLSLKSTQFSNRARPSFRSDSPYQKRAASPPSITNSLPVSGFMSNPPTGPNFVRCPSPEGDILARGAAGEAPIWTAVVALMAGTSPQ